MVLPKIQKAKITTRGQNREERKKKAARPTSPGSYDALGEAGS
jgi:hypothetical protein